MTKAELVLRRRIVLGETVYAEIMIWRVPSRVRGLDHDYKYRLALVADGECVIRYDNEAGKGDHRHVGRMEEPYGFTNPARLIEDFRSDIEEWRSR